MQIATELTPQPVTPIFQRYRIWRWIAIYAQMVMELSWIVPWYRSLTPATYAASEGRVFGVFLLVMLVHFGLAWLVNLASFKLIVRRVILAISLAISIFIAYRYLLYFQQSLTPVELLNRPFRLVAEFLTVIPDEFVVAFFVISIGLRGISIASQMVSPGAMVWRFQLGVGMLILFAFVNTMVTGEAPGGVFPVFLFAGLIAMSAARLAILERLRGGRIAAFDQRWFLGIFITCGLAVLAATAIGNLVNLPLSETLLALVNSALLAFFALVLLLLAPILFILLFVLVRLNRMLAESNAFPELVENLQTIIASTSGLAAQMADWIERYLPVENLRLVFIWGTVLIALILGLGLAGLAWATKRASDPVQEETEALEKPLLQQIKQFLLNSMHAINQTIQDQFKNRDVRRARQRIRRIYQEVLALSQSLSVHITPGQTPLELIPLLAELFRPLEADVRLITEAYQRVRYGELPEKGEDLASIERAKDRIVTLGKKRKQRPG